MNYKFELQIELHVKHGRLKHYNIFERPTWINLKVFRLYSDESQNVTTLSISLVLNLQNVNRIQILSARMPASR